MVHLSLLSGSFSDALSPQVSDILFAWPPTFESVPTGVEYYSLNTNKKLRQLLMSLSRNGLYFLYGINLMVLRTKVFGRNVKLLVFKLKFGALNNPRI